jgi:excisionase family DNA binding protein
MTEQYVSDCVAVRRRKLDELFADQPYLSATMMASRLHERMADERPPVHIPVVSMPDSDDEVLVRLIEGRRRNAFPTDATSPEPQARTSEPENASERGRPAREHVSPPDFDTTQDGWTRLELLVDFRACPPRIRGVDGTEFGREVMTVAETAQFLRVSPKTVRAWVRQGQLPCARMGRRLRFRRTAVLEWMQRQEQDGGARPAPPL